MSEHDITVAVDPQMNGTVSASCSCGETVIDDMNGVLMWSWDHQGEPAVQQNEAEMTEGNQTGTHMKHANTDRCPAETLAEHIMTSAETFAAHCTCAEAEHLAAFLRSVVGATEAEEFLLLHARGDDDPFDDHHHLYQIQL